MFSLREASAAVRAAGGAVGLLARARQAIDAAAPLNAFVGSTAASITADAAAAEVRASLVTSLVQRLGDAHAVPPPRSPEARSGAGRL